MADKKITELSATTSVATNDLLYIVTDVASTAASKKVTFETINDALVIVGSQLDDLNTVSTTAGELPLANIASITEAKLSLSDNTTANASTTAHGLVPKLSGVSTQYLNGEGVFTTPPDTIVTDETISVSDVDTNNASTSAHGFLPKLSGVSTQYLNGEGVFAVPAGGGGGASATEVVFTNGDLSTGILTVTHSGSLSSRFSALAQVINNSGSMVIPDEINNFSTNSFKVDLSSYGTISGDWACIYVVKG